MLMGKILTAMIFISLVCGITLGTGDAVSAAVVEGGQSGVTLCLGMAGAICLWSGVMEVMRRSGLASQLSRLLRPLLSRLYPRAEGGTVDTISANFSANLLGLGNAATPLGIEAARRLNSRGDGVASDEMCTLVVCNTASVQLIPTTVAAVRSGLGSGSPFDILPAVWLASLISVCVGLSACRIFRRIWPD